MSSKATEIYESILKLVPDLPELQPGAYRRYRSGSLMDLSLDVLNIDTSGGEAEITIALAHNYLHPSGDLIPDPDMEIRIFLGRRFAEALSYQDSYCYRVVYEAQGCANTRELEGQNDFLLSWLRNIIAQGYRLIEQRDNDE